MRRNSKIREVEELAKILASIRNEHRKIVLCHGVFDLLHIGHIRHFQQAKHWGDILVVTVTPDKYVNKGPHRPAFPENLRAEAIAALDCVDFVALNKWPMAVETIELLRPDIYVKGSEYKEAAKDRSGGITLEDRAIQSVGGRIVFTEDITFSSSSLINNHLPVFPKETSEYLLRFSQKYGPSDIIQYLDCARSLKVLVVGETIVDEYQYCEAIGKSSKEPTLAVKQLSTERFAGGILAVGNHVANFCDTVGLVSFLGAESSHEDFVKEKLSRNIKPTFLYRKSSPTIVKRRFIESYFFTKLFETYEINDGLLDAVDNEKLCATLREEVPRYDVVIVVDFGHGMLSQDAIDIVSRKSRFFALNAQSNAGNMGYQTIARYPCADFICLTEAEIRLEARDRRGNLRGIVRNASEKQSCRRIIVTQGKYGSLCYSDSEGFCEVPAFAGQVVDRVGAGDAFLSLAALCAAQNAPIEVVGFIGNVAGAQAVATVGNRRSVERVPVLKNIESLLK